MTRIAGIRRARMRYRFTRRNGAVMTAVARTRHLRVIDFRGGIPRCRRVTRIARIRTQNMIGGFSSRGGAVVTGCARTCHLRVIDARRRTPHRR